MVKSKHIFHLDLRDIPQIWRQMPDGKYVYFLP